jgi:hypothetical protein
MAQLYNCILDQIARFFILLSDAPEGGGTDNDDNLTRWSTINTTIHNMMGGIGSGNGQRPLMAVLAYYSKVAVVKIVSGSGGGGLSGRAHNNH